MMFDQLAIGTKSVLTFKKCPLVAELKLKILQNGRFSHFQFQLCHQRALFKCLHIFSIYGHLVKKATFKFLKDGLVVK